jgi:hypothetical protein
VIAQVLDAWHSDLGVLSIEHTILPVAKAATLPATMLIAHATVAFSFLLLGL